MNTQPAIPWWQTVLSIIGVSSLIGTLLGNFLSHRRDRSHWISDNKKAEWRELIMQLDQSMTVMANAFSFVGVMDSDNSNSPHFGMQTGFRTIEDRIFIADAVKKFEIAQKWEQLCKYVGSASDPAHSTSQRGSATHTGFNLLARTFRESVLDSARKDLDL